MIVHNLGTFTLHTHDLVASDPTYVPGSYGQQLISPVVKGEWDLYGVFDDAKNRKGTLVQVTVAHHRYGRPHMVEFTPEPVLVESGMLCFYDSVSYKKDHLVEMKYRLTGGVGNWATQFEALRYNTDPLLLYLFGAGVLLPQGMKEVRVGVAKNDKGLITAAEICL